MNIYYKSDEYTLTISSELSIELNSIRLCDAYYSKEFGYAMDIINAIAPLELNEIQWRLIDQCYSIGYRQQETINSKEDIYKLYETLEHSNTNESVYIDGERMELETPDRPIWKPVTYRPKAVNMAVNTDTNYIEERLNNTNRVIEALSSKELDKYSIYLLNTLIDSLTLTNKQYSTMQQLLTITSDMKYKDRVDLLVSDNLELTFNYDDMRQSYIMEISTGLYNSILNELETQCDSNVDFLTESFFSAKSAESSDNVESGNYKILYADEQASYRANIESWTYRQLSTVNTKDMSSFDLKCRHHELMKKAISRRYVVKNREKAREELTPSELCAETVETYESKLLSLYGW